MAVVGRNELIPPTAMTWEIISLFIYVLVIFPNNLDSTISVSVHNIVFFAEFWLILYIRDFPQVSFELCTTKWNDDSTVDNQALLKNIILD